MNSMLFATLLSAASLLAATTFSEVAADPLHAGDTSEAPDIDAAFKASTRATGKHTTTTTSTPHTRHRTRNTAHAGIVGGVRSNPGDFPYFVDMGGCGGALIAPDIVLFAAHCESWNARQVVIGAYRVDTLAGGARDRFCDEWIPDPKYEYLDWGVVFDFALCKLNEPVVLSSISNVATLKLNEDESFPTDDPDAEPTELIAMGVGDLSENAISSPRFLHNVTIPYIPNAVCKALNRYQNSIADSSLCAGFLDGKKDSCVGDSGGPLVKRTYVGNGDTGNTNPNPNPNANANANTAFVDTHVGVVSWGFGCANKNKPGVYARTSARVGWIKATACNTLNSIADFCKDVPKSTESKSTRKATPPTPTASSTASSTYSCSTGQDLTIRLTTDNFAYETAWVLENSKTFQTITTRKYLIKNHTNEHKICLPSNSNSDNNDNDNDNDNACYTWEVSDTEGDGFDGSYGITLNGNQIAAGNGEDFADRKIESFCTNDAIAMPPKKEKKNKTTKSPKTVTTKSTKK